MKIERHGIIWQFDGEHETATYANGDICVKGPISGFIASTTEGGEVSTVGNPVPGETQGVTNRNDWLAGSFDPALRVGTTIMPGTSLVTHAVHLESNLTPQVKRAAVLTVVLELPEDGAEFRPPYAGPIKTQKRRLADMTNPAPSIDEASIADPAALVHFNPDDLARVWPDFLNEWSGRYLHPAENMPDYGRDMSVVVGSAMMALCLLPPRQMRTTLIRLVQLGIDMHGLYVNGGEWTAAGGHSHGRLPPILLAALAFEDPQMADVDATRFAEGNQTFYIERDPISGVINAGNGDYGVQDVGKPEWAHSHIKWPHNDNASWSDQDNPYRFCCSANSWIATITALRLMGLLHAMDHPACPAYLDRYVRWCKANGVPNWWIHYNQPWHLEAYGKLRLSDAPGTDTFGYGRYKLLADIPAHPGEQFRVRIRGPKAVKVFIVLGPVAKLPSRSPALPPETVLPPGVTFTGRSYVQSVDAHVAIDHTSTETTFDIPIPTTDPGTKYVLQAFAIHDDGVIYPSNALEVKVQPSLPR